MTADYAFKECLRCLFARGLCSATVEENGGFDVVPVGAQMIARRQETAALRNLNPVYVRFGSITSDLTTDEFVGCPLHLPPLPSFGTAAMEPYMFRPVVWSYQAQGGTPK